MQAPVHVLTTTAKRESGKKAQFGNIAAAKVGAREGGGDGVVDAVDDYAHAQ